ncbi:MAG TPA: NAD-dependent epimerase/dehydratase family protein [Puia sp.]|nr:NAD-dependent epimerase/dehydratase family protein [Puia sp.]
MEKILVTGGAGFIGSSLIEKLLQSQKYFVAAVDNLATGFQANLPQVSGPAFKFIKADANNYEALSTIMLSYRFDFVFHYAAVVGVKKTLENPIMVLEDIQGIKNVLELSKNTGVKKVFFSSSSEVYGEPVELPQNEHSTPLNSRLPYAIVKNLGEAYFKSYFQEYGLEYTIFRFFNTYGPKQSPSFVMSKFIKAALGGQDITIYGDGSQTRTFCYIDDNIDACVGVFEKHLHTNDVLNVGNDRETSVLELARLVIEKTGSDSKIIFLPPLPEGDMTRRQPDIIKMKSVLKRELLPLEKGIAKILGSDIFYQLNHIEQRNK